MTLGTLWYEVTRDVENETANIDNTERLGMVSFELRTVATVLYHLFGNFYEKTVIFHRRQTAKYLNGGTGNYVAATKTLTGTMNIPFNAYDRECLVGFRVGGSGAGADNYLPYVDDVLSDTSIVVRGDQLPSANTGVNAIELYSTVINVDGISLGSLDMMRVNAPFQFKIESSLTDQIDALSHDELIRWDKDARHNQGRIAWTISGDMALMKKATDLGANYGTILGRYPGMPRALNLDTDDIHLPEGAPQSILLLRLKKRVRERFGGKPMPEYEGNMKNLIEMAHVAYGFSAKSQEVTKATEALN